MSLTQGIPVLVHYRDHEDTARHLTLRITVHPKWFERTVRAAVVGPFCDAYKKRREIALDAFELRCCDARGSAVEGCEPVGSVARALAGRRADGCAELFLVGPHFVCDGRWRDVVETAPALVADAAGTFPVWEALHLDRAPT